MKIKEFAKFLERDKRCYHCGKTDDTLVPQHRKNRGMGGSKLRDNPANIVVLCSYINGVIESSSVWQDYAKKRGWKLESWQEATRTPVYDSLSNKWFMLDNRYNRVALKEEKNADHSWRT